MYIRNNIYNFCRIDLVLKNLYTYTNQARHCFFFYCCAATGKIKITSTALQYYILAGWRGIVIVFPESPPHSSKKGCLYHPNHLISWSAIFNLIVGGFHFSHDWVRRPYYLIQWKNLKLRRPTLSFRISH